MVRYSLTSICTKCHATNWSFYVLYLWATWIRPVRSHRIVTSYAYSTSSLFSISMSRTLIIERCCRINDAELRSRPVGAGVVAQPPGARGGVGVHVAAQRRRRARHQRHAEARPARDHERRRVCAQAKLTRTWLPLGASWPDQEVGGGFCIILPLIATG